jgi:hypothetical protein
MAVKTKAKPAPKAKPPKSPKALNLAQPTRVRVIRGKPIVVRQQARFLFEWTPKLIRSAKVQAESGNFQLLGDLFEDLLGSDDRHHGTLASVAQRTLGLPLSFDADGDGRRKSKIEKAVEEDFPELAPLGELVDLVSQGLSVGFAVGQLVPWKMSRRGHRWLPKIQPVDTRCVRYSPECQEWYVMTSEGEVKITPGDGQWVLFLPYGSVRPWIRGTWRACAVWALLKTYAVKDWARNGEHAAGIKSVKTPKGAKDTDRREAAEALAEIGADGVFVPMPEWEMDLIQQTANTYQTFMEQINTANKAIAVANKGESHTSGDGASGMGDSAGKTRKEVSDEKSTFVARGLELFLYEQLLGPWSNINFGGGAPIPWPHFQTEQEEDLTQKATTWKTAAESIGALKAQGINVDAEAVCVEFSVPTKEGEPVLIEPEEEDEEASGDENPENDPEEDPEAASQKVEASGDDSEEAQDTEQEAAPETQPLEIDPEIS